jgi:hypothetical protein
VQEGFNFESIGGSHRLLWRHCSFFQARGEADIFDKPFLQAACIEPSGVMSAWKQIFGRQLQQKNQERILALNVKLHDPDATETESASAALGNFDLTSA